MYNSLNDEQKCVFNKYKANEDFYALNLNTFLRNSKYFQNTFTNDILILDSFFEIFFNDFSQRLYRGTRECHFSQFHEFDVYENPDFLSTSLDIKVAISFLENVSDPLLLIFEPSKELKAFDFESNPVFCNDESEFLVCRKQKFTLEKDYFLEGVPLNNLLKSSPLHTIAKLRVVELSIVV